MKRKYAQPPLEEALCEFRLAKLDIEYFTYKPSSLLAEDFLNWLEKAHEVIEKIFEGCITDKLRKIFKEEKV